MHETRNSFPEAKMSLLETSMNSHFFALTREYNGGRNSFHLLE
jgi:hypothetical protein